MISTFREDWNIEFFSLRIVMMTSIKMKIIQLFLFYDKDNSRRAFTAFCAIFRNWNQRGEYLVRPPEKIEKVKVGQLTLRKVSSRALHDHMTVTVGFRGPESTCVSLRNYERKSSSDFNGYLALYCCWRQQLHAHHVFLSIKLSPKIALLLERTLWK